MMRELWRDIVKDCGVTKVKSKAHESCQRKRRSQNAIMPLETNFSLWFAAPENLHRSVPKHFSATYPLVGKLHPALYPLFCMQYFSEVSVVERNF